MWAKHKKQPGFTIVELLIVIVVIGILAAVSIVAFNGVQQRARNTQTGSAVSQYLKLFKIYIADGNSYPSTGNYACLGEDYPSDLCWNNGVAENASLNTLLKSQGNKLPMPGLISQSYSGIIYVPASINWKLDGQAVNWIVYAIDGKTTTERCPVGPVATYLGGGGTDFSSTSPASGQSQAGTASQNPTCWIPLT